MAAAAAAAASAPMNKIERAHQMYREGLYEEALGFYTEALGLAKTKPQKIALHSNRAACFLKLHDFKKTHGVESIIRNVSKPSHPFEDTIGKSLAPIPEAEAELEEEDDDIDVAEPKRCEEVQEEKDLLNSEVGRDEKNEFEKTTPTDEVTPPQTQSNKGSSEQNSRGWQAIPKPKGHSQLDYSRWDRVEDESSEDDDDEDDEESQPQYRFRVRTVGVRPVK